MRAGQGSRTAGVTEPQGQVTSLTEQIVILVIVVVINITILVIHVLVLLPGQCLAHRSSHAGPLARQGHHLLGFVLHGRQGLLDRFLSDLTVVPGADKSQCGVSSDIKYGQSD